MNASSLLQHNGYEEKANEDDSVFLNIEATQKQDLHKLKNGSNF
jgi:cold shock CspA family protein